MSEGSTVKTIKILDEDVHVDATGKDYIRAVFQCQSCEEVHAIQLGVPNRCGLCIDKAFEQIYNDARKPGKTLLQRLFNFLGAA